MLYAVPQGKKEIGARVSVEFYDEDGACNDAKKWYKGTTVFIYNTIAQIYK